jgi:hypothetical protein
LRYESDALRHQTVRLEVGDVLSVEDHLTFVDAYESEERFEQGGLAGAVGPDDADQFSAVGVEIAAIEDVDPWEVAGDEVVGNDQSVRHRRQVRAAIRNRVIPVLFELDLSAVHFARG